MIFPFAPMMRALFPVALAMLAFMEPGLAQEANPNPGGARNLITNGTEDGSLSMPEGNTETPSPPELLPQSSAMPIRAPLMPAIASPAKPPEGQQISATSKPASLRHQPGKNRRRSSHAGRVHSSHSALVQRARLHTGTRVNLQHRSLRREHHAYRHRRRVVVYEYIDWGP